MSPWLLRLMQNLAGVASDILVDTAEGYWRLLKFFTLRASLGIAAGVLLLLIGYGLGIGLLVSLGLLIVGLAMATWVALASPLILLVGESVDKIGPVRRAVRPAGFILVSAISMATYVYLSGIWQHPRLFRALLVLFAFLMSMSLIGAGGPLKSFAVRARMLLTFLTIVGSVQALLAYLPPSVLMRSRQVVRAALPGAPDRVRYDASTFGSLELFDGFDGTPLKWYAVDGDGNYELDEDGRIALFDNVGASPYSSGELMGITPDVVADIRASFNAPIPPTRSAVATSIVTLTDCNFFDIATGESKYWYVRRDNGAVDLLNGSGFHPETMQEALPVTAEVAAELCTSLEATEAKAVTDLAKEHASVLRARIESERDNYLQRRPSAVRLGVLLARDGAIDPLSSEAAATVDGAALVFKRPFVRDGLLAQVLEGDLSQLASLKVGEIAEAVFLGGVAMTISESTVEGERIVKAVVVVDGRLVDLQQLSLKDSLIVEGTGVGFSSSDAERRARLDVAEKLAQTLNRLAR